MRDAPQMSMGAFPRPGPALRMVLLAIATLAVAGAVVFNWAPGPPRGPELFQWVAFQPAHPQRVWTFLTSGLLTMPVGISHALYSLIGLYFFTTELEKRWGGWRLVRFLAASVVIGNLMVLAVHHMPFLGAAFQTGMCVGPMAAITAVVIAWSRLNPGGQIRLFFVLPMSGRLLFWLTVAFALLSPLFMQGTPEGIVAPLGGVVSGLLLAGNPSPLRSAWLRVKLAVLRRQSGTVSGFDAIPDSTARPRTTAKRPGKNPPLRVVYGGLEDELKNRKPPKDKRHLN